MSLLMLIITQTCHGKTYTSEDHSMFHIIYEDRYLLFVQNIMWLYRVYCSQYKWLPIPPFHGYHVKQSKTNYKMIWPNDMCILHPVYLVWLKFWILLPIYGKLYHITGSTGCLKYQYSTSMVIWVQYPHRDYWQIETIPCI